MVFQCFYGMGEMLLGKYHYVKCICIKNVSSNFHLSSPDDNRQANEDKYDTIEGFQGSLV